MSKAYIRKLFRQSEDCPATARNEAGRVRFSITIGVEVTEDLFHYKIPQEVTVNSVKINFTNRTLTVSGFYYE